MEDPQTLFLIHILDGYSFRNTVGIIKTETDNATMVLSPKTIEISFMNTSKCAIHKITLNTPEFRMYHYNIRDSNGELFKEYPIAFETNEMFNTTKGIGRKDGIRLYWLAGDNKINVQPIKMSTKDPGRAGALFVKILSMEHMRYDPPNAYTTEPNVRVQAKDFADICSQVNTLKCNSLDIVGQRHGVTFKGMLPNNTMASINRFVSQTDVMTNTSSQPATNIEDIEDLINNIKKANSQSGSSGLSLNVVKSEDLTTVKVPISTVKALSKIHNISPPGALLRFHFAECQPTKIESPIGIYGLYTICLRNKRG